MRIPLLFAIPVLLLAACTSPTNSGVGTAEQSMVVDESTSVGSTTVTWGSSPLTDLSKNRKVKVTLPVGHVYYLLTNTSASTGSVAQLGGVTDFAGTTSATSRSAGFLRSATATLARTAPRWTRFEPEQQPTPRLVKGPRARTASGGSYTAPTVGSTFVFYDLSEHNTPKTQNQSQTTLRYRSSLVGNRYLNIWVADDCWSNDGTTAAFSNPGTYSWHPPKHYNSDTNAQVNTFITLAMVQAMAAQFLSSGTTDIYGYVTSVFGKEWSDSGSPFDYSNLIDGHQEINIFVKNLNPGLTSNTTSLELGYFNSGNNYTTGDVANSNQKVLFAVDADTVANNSTDSSNTATTTWDILDYWPAQALSTLAHEFQHMIHFYQKQVTYNVGYTDRWINEMCSVLTEDLVSDKLGTLGPRGIASDYSTGSSNNFEGRIPLFNIFHDWVSLTGWGYGAVPSDFGGNQVVNNYSCAYTFGAWLIRNYGGPSLLQKMVQSSGTNYQAVVDAVNANGGNGATFASLTRDWGLATFMESSNQSGFAYTSGTAPGTSFSWSDWSGYHVGSIDLGKYYCYTDSHTLQDQDGPLIYGSSFAADAYGNQVVSSGETSIHDMGTLSSSTTVTVTLPPSVILTVVTVPAS